ncbi:MAG: iron donor protein CyaY [Pseudomonadales bacterium]|jgi:CyaY protein|nr:iron donor protein CyaY [Pseudomonadales bacterium]
MTDAEFLALYHATLSDIETLVEDAITEHDAEIDYESGNDMLTLSFRTGTVAIISRQSAVHQLWLAARSGGFHFEWDEAQEQWLCTLNGQTLQDMLSEVCLEQGGVRVRFN